MVDVLLIQPPIEDFYFTRKRSVPYGLVSIAASLRKDGFSVEVFDSLASTKSRVIDTPSEMRYLNTIYGPRDTSPFALFHDYRHFGYSYQMIKQVIQRSDAFVVGIASMFTPYADVTAKLARLTRETLPGARIVIGGHHASALPEKVMEIPEVDFVIRGEAETAFPLLVKRLKENGPVSDVPGLVYKTPNGELRIKPKTIIDKLDQLPAPDNELVKWSFYKRHHYGSGVIVASRGCPMGCSYCSVSRDSGVPYRRRSVTAVLDEMDRMVKDHDIRFIDFEDENLTLNRDWTRSLMKGIIQRHGSQTLELRAMNGMMPSTLDETTIGLMAEAGFKTLNLSLCTLSKSQLKRFNRSDQRLDYESALSFAEQLSLEVVTYIIVGAPYQLAATSLEDLIYLSDKNSIVGVSVYFPSPASLDFEQYKPEGIFPEDFILTRSSAIPISHSTSRLESVTLLRLGRILNYMKAVFPGFGFKPTETRLDPPDERTAAGLALLKGLFQKNIIWGLTPEGEKFKHEINEALVSQFTSALRSHLPRAFSNSE